MGSVKARDLVEGWPRSKSTSAFTGVRIMTMSGNRYRVLRLPWDRAVRTIDVEQHTIITDDFRRQVENTLEEEYKRGQEEMLNRFRAEYRTLTDEDKMWLWSSDASQLKDAMKQSFRQFADSPAIPPDLLVVIKNCAAEDKPFWYRWRLASVDWHPYEN